MRCYAGSRLALPYSALLHLLKPRPNRVPRTTDPTFKEKFLVPSRYEPLLGSPEQFAAFMKADTAKWTKVIKDANVKVD